MMHGTEGSSPSAPAKYKKPVLSGKRRNTGFFDI